MSEYDLRKVFTEELLKLAQVDRRIFALATDSRGSVTLDAFAKELPDQFVECGIAEQDAVGIAAGLANAGLRPFACGPASFYSMRSAEQVKVDVAYSHTNVKLFAVSGGISYGALGSTHHSTQDIALMRAIPGLEVYIPSDGAAMLALTRYLAASDTPAYIRVGRGAVPAIYDDYGEFMPGRAMRLRKGKSAAVIACGEMTYPALQAAQMLAAEGTDVAVYDMVSIKPIDESAIYEAAQTGFVLTVEEHSIYGGLGGAVAEFTAQHCPVRMRIMGLPDEKVYNGTSAQAKQHYGLTPEGIAQALREGVRGR